MAEVLAFPSPETPPRTLEEYVKIVHELAKKSENVYLDHPHAKQRMAERGITIQQIYDVLRNGRGVDGPSLDQYGCWRVKLMRFSAGKTVQVVVVVRERHLEVVTNREIKVVMSSTTYHYTECGLNNIYLLNGYQFRDTPRGKAVSIKDIDGLHKAIGMLLVTSKKDLSGEEFRFLRHEMLMSQSTLAKLLGVSEQAIRRWEKGKVAIHKPSESLLRLLYREHVHDRDGKIATVLKKIADLEEMINDKELHFKDTSKGWQSAA